MSNSAKNQNARARFTYQWEPGDVIVGERNCSTVAVAAFDFSMLAKKWAVRLVRQPRKKSADYGIFVIVNNRKDFIAMNKWQLSRIKPANIKRVIVKNCDDIGFAPWCIARRPLNFPTTRRHQNVQHPLSGGTHFSLCILFFVYVCRHDSKNGEDGSVCATRFFLAQTGELNIFNKQQANHAIPNIPIASQNNAW